MLTRIKSYCKSNVFIALALSLSVAFVFACITGFRLTYVDSNDDYIMSNLLANGEENSVFLSYFLTCPLVGLYKAIPEINWFMLIQQFLCFFSIIVFNYVIVSLFPRIIRIIFVIFIDTVLFSTSFFTSQWTLSSAVICGANIFLLLYSLFFEERIKWRIFQIFTAVLLIISGSLYRFDSFIMCVLPLFVMGFGLGLIYLIEKWKTVSKGSIQHLKNSKLKIVSVLLVVLVVFSTFGVHFVSEKIKLQSEEYVKYSVDNLSRSRYQDYDTISYDGNESFYQSIGIVAQSDLDLADKLYTDKDFFLESGRFDSITDYSAQQRFKGDSKTVFAIKRIYKTIRNEIAELRQYFPFQIGKRTFFLLFIALLFVVTVVLFIVMIRIRKKDVLRFRKIIRVLFPIALIILWAIFFIVYKFENNLLYVLLALFSILSVILFNKKYYIVCLLLDLYSMAVYTYQSLFRMGFRVKYVVVIPAILSLLFLIGLMYSKRKGEPSSISTILVCVVLLFGAVPICFGMFFGIYLPISEKHDETVTQFISSNSDVTFVYSCRLYEVIDKNYTNPVLTPEYPDNAISYGDWDYNSPVYIHTLESKGISNLFAYMINNDQMRFVFFKTDGNEDIKLHESFYNNHYAHDGKTIHLEEDTCLPYFPDNKDSDKELFVGFYKVVEK